MGVGAGVCWLVVGMLFSVTGVVSLSHIIEVFITGKIIV